jgi:hypothetical protein
MTRALSVLARALAVAGQLALTLAVLHALRATGWLSVVVHGDAWDCALCVCGYHTARRVLAPREGME